MIRTLRDAEIEIERLKDALATLKPGITKETTVIDQTKTITVQQGSGSGDGGVNFGGFVWDNPTPITLRLRGSSPLDLGIITFSAPTTENPGVRSIIVDAGIYPRVDAQVSLGSETKTWLSAFIGSWKISGNNIIPAGLGNLGTGAQKLAGVYTLDAYIDRLHLAEPISVANGGTGHSTYGPGNALVGSSDGRGIDMVPGITFNTGIGTLNVGTTVIQYKNQLGNDASMTVVTSVDVGGWQTISFRNGIATATQTGYGI